MANDAEMRGRFGRVISAIRALIDSLTAQDAAWVELKKDTVGVYADSALACRNARQAFLGHLRNEGWPTDPNKGMAGRCVQGLIDVLEKNYGGDVKKMPYVVNKEVA